MTFAAINWLSISIHLLQAIFVIVSALMTLLILMQRPKQEGLGAAFGGGVTDQVFGARTTNVLQRGTVYLGSMFFILALALAVLVGQANKTTSTRNKQERAANEQKAKNEVVPAPPETPKSLTEELPPAEPAPVDSSAPADVPPDASTPAPENPSPVVVPPSETAPTSPPVVPTEDRAVTPPIPPVTPPPAEKPPEP